MLFVILSQATAQIVAPPNTYLWDGDQAAPNNVFWDLGNNWNIGNSGADGANNAVPLAYYHETAVIGSAAFPGPFNVRVRGNQNLFFGAGTSPPANNRSQTAGVTVDLGSTLTIDPAATLKVVTTNGFIPGDPAAMPAIPDTATIGTETGLPVVGTGDATINGGGAITIQSGGLLDVEDDVNVNNGTLTVSPGGTVTAQNVGSGEMGAIVLSGNASLTSTNSMTASGRTTITGPSVAFNSGPFNMTGTSVFNPVVTNATTHSIMNVNGAVAIAGTLRPQIQGTTPTLASSWQIWDAQSASGEFTTFDDSLTDLPTGHRYNVRTQPGGLGSQGFLIVENFLTAEVNRANGQVTLRNTAATGGVTIDGYQITSAAAVLNPTKFTSSFTDDGFDGGEWVETNLSAGTIGELNAVLNGNSLITTSSANLLGNFYDPIPTLDQFGVAVPEDLVFTYRRSDGRTVTGVVEYINDGIDNTLVLQVDPTTGNARIVNDSAFDGVQFDGYRVRSALGSLTPGTWNSLDDQNFGDGNWLESPTTGISANALSELNPLGALEVDAGQTAAVLGTVFNPAGARDLVFDFRAASPTTGAPMGDYNENGVVDAADYTVWRDRLGQIIALPNEDPNASPGMVAQDDYDVWKANFGSTGGAGGLGPFQVFTGAVRYASFSLGSGASALAVPEPSTAGLAMILFCGLASARRRRVLD
jgi:hypothetical protein